jgi:hypothetical protein
VAGGVEHDVFQLEVAVHDAELVQRLERHDQLTRIRPRGFFAKRAVRAPAGRGPVRIAHHAE